MISIANLSNRYPKFKEKVAALKGKETKALDFFVEHGIAVVYQDSAKKLSIFNVHDDTEPVVLDGTVDDYISRQKP